MLSDALTRISLESQVSNPNWNSKNALARVFPAFGRAPMPLDYPSRGYAQSNNQVSNVQPIIEEPGAPPATRVIRQLNSSTKSLPTAQKVAAETQSKTRFGQIAFANCLPILLPIERRHVELDAHIILESPARLNALLQEGKLDVASISSFYYLSRRDLTLCPQISISCFGEVGSVLFFTKVDPGQLSCSTVVVSAQSATSTNLLKILFAEQYGFMPQIAADLRPDLDCPQYDAALVIGDRALEVDNQWSQQYSRIDLGAWWYQRYRLPMVFGVWAAPTAWAEANQATFAEVNHALRTAKLLGLTRRWKDTLYEAHRRTGLSLSRLEQYYKQELNFDFTDAHAEGLSMYQHLLHKHHLLS
jgi:chorismate dehydratase